jgi:hypothetical protein
MSIAVIGTGNIGSGLARTLAAASLPVTVAGAGPEDGLDLSRKLELATGLRVKAATVADAVAAARLVILAVPYGAVADIAGQVDLSGKVVVDVSNPIEADFSGIVVGHTSSAAEEIQKLVPGARVVKAFNTVFAQVYEHGLAFGDRQVQTFVASDDAEAKADVIALARAAGFDPVDAGPLTNARYIEPLGYLNIQFGYMLGQGTQIAPAWLHR